MANLAHSDTPGHPKASGKTGAVQISTVGVVPWL